MMRMSARTTPLLALLVIACATALSNVDRVKAYRAAHDRGDVAAEAAFLAPGARIFYERREGEGDPLTAGRSGRYAHWDEFFRSRTTLTDWKEEGDAVSATVHESNDFYRLLDWTPRPYRMTWWLGADGRITAAMVESIPGETKSRMKEFQEWARANRADELAYLMPNGRIDPTEDRAERFKKILLEWRKAAGLD